MAAPLTGTRIRERRAAAGMRQADLARAVGISPSYLNLIEHNRRGIAGKLLIDIARILQVEVAALTEGAEAGLLAALGTAAARFAEAGPETARVEELAGRFPGWARMIAAQSERLQAAERTVDTLADRLTHDPFLSETVHEILSTVTAIRSTASILAQTPDIDPDWRARFHDNLFRDSRRLSDTSEALVAYFDQMSQQESAFSTPPDAVDGFAAAHRYHFPALEAGGAPADVLGDGAELGSQAARRLALAYLDRYAQDARAMPLEAFEEAAEAARFDPAQLAATFGVDLLAVFRRLASLPPGPGRPVYGLVTCDGSGTATFRKPLPGFSLPRYGAACPLWPLFQALTRPSAPLRETVETPENDLFAAWAVCLPAAGQGFGGPQIVEAGMLFTRAGPALEPSVDGPARPVGTSCRICARSGCAARREPSILKEGF